MWHAIEHGLELLKLGVIWRVGNGVQIRAWRDPLIPREGNQHPRSAHGRCLLRWEHISLTLMAPGTKR
jgi:hypothetical protein